MKNLIGSGILVMLFITIGCKKDIDSEPVNPFNNKTTAVFNSNKHYGTVKDIDGNVYKTITIGSKTWMAENLRVTKYRNGDPIPEVKDNSSWSNLTSGAYCNYKNTQSNDTIASFGRLYNWHVVIDSRNVAPEGWRVPTDEDWTELVTYLGGDLVSGGKLKESGLNHWTSPNTGGNNDSGLTFLPGGYRDFNGGSNNIGIMGFYGGWWSSSAFDNTFAWYRDIYTNASTINRTYYKKTGGFSIRCVKDNN